ncbi:MAG: FecR family protein, partial [Nitrosomonadales bacterium]|nr:FecR family protein [Nitrosomonadales bacterium]
MNTEKIFTLNRQAMIALLVSAAFPATSLAAAGRVEFAIGGATAISADGAARQLNKGAEINSGDTIKTTADGRVQVRFTDGGYMSFQPNTEFRIENYNYDGKQDGSERGFFRLVEGGLRAITGIVGRNNRPAYRVATPVATIGIRGSEYVTDYSPSDSKLKIRVIGGSIYIENEFGNLILFKGQSAEAKEGAKPGYSEEESGVQAKGPEGGDP